MTKMQNSAGNAMQEMEKVYDSLEYKLNKFQETWVGVAQNLVQTDQFKFVVDFFTGLSGAVEGATSALGLFGTAAVAVLVGQVAKSVGGAKIRGLPCAHVYLSSDWSSEPAA